MEKTTKALEPIDASGLKDLVKKAETTPENYKIVSKAVTINKGGFLNDTLVRDLTPVVIDEPCHLFGTNSTPNPSEHVLASLGACLAVGYMANATAMEIPLEELRLELEGDMDISPVWGVAKTPGEQVAGFTEIRVNAFIKGDFTPEQEATMQEKVLRWSPVANTMRNNVNLAALLHVSEGKEDKVLEPIDGAGLKDLVQKAEATPENYRVVSKAVTINKGGFLNDTFVRDLNPVVIDEPCHLFGTNSTPNPSEHVLASLGACLAVGYMANATDIGIPLEELRLELEGDMDISPVWGVAKTPEEQVAGFTEIRVKAYITGNLTAEQEKIMQEKVLRWSPVANTIRNNVNLVAHLNLA
ncbi:OsmC family protein [Bacillus benzoevorans]|uniref:Putative OsmC-like protein n=1 Tax=Bacillus benzoevorans TaxID=1456 RepID=A0A7X0HSZ7_9BACI|nr:OsmC family protein [Bacillus benzoevorans]MBB6446295.1 putative OsmC-like protein [Bacillus benzoevorans]